MANVHDSGGKLAALRVRYESRLAGKLSALGEAIELARAGGAEGLDDAIRQAHNLHGTAGSYGFLEISSILGRAEARLRELKAEAAAGPVPLEAVLDLLREAKNAHENSAG